MLSQLPPFLLQPGRPPDLPLCAPALDPDLGSPTAQRGLHSCGGCSKTQVLAGGGSGALGDPSARVSGGCSVWWAGALTTLLHTHRGVSSVSHPCLRFQALFLAAVSPSLAHQPLGLFHNKSIAFKNSSSSSSYQKHLLGPTRLSPGGQGWYRDSELFRVNGPYRHYSG